MLVAYFKSLDLEQCFVWYNVGNILGHLSQSTVYLTLADFCAT